MEPNRINEQVIIEAQNMLLQFLRNTAKEKGITITKIAEATGYKQSSVSRMLAGKYNITLKAYIKIAAAIDCYLLLEDKNAPNTEIYFESKCKNCKDFHTEGEIKEYGKCQNEDFNNYISTRTKIHWDFGCRFFNFN